jgi:hypothetical protein
MACGIKVKAIFVSSSHPLCVSKGDFLLDTNKNPATFDDGVMPEISALFHSKLLNLFYLLIKCISSASQIKRQRSIMNMSLVSEKDRLICFIIRYRVIKKLRGQLLILSSEIKGEQVKYKPDKFIRNSSDKPLI